MKLLKRLSFDHLYNVFVISLISVLSLFDLKFRSGSITLRMATASSDDNPIVYSLVRRFPERYEFDFYARLIADTQQNSIISRVSYFVLNSNLLDEKNLWIALYCLQRVLLYFSVYFFVSCFTKSRFQIVLILSIFASTPVYYWNLGWFGALDDQPYPMWMTLPLVIIGLAFVLKRQYRNLHLSIIIATLIHPSMGFIFAGWAVFYFILNKDKRRVIQFAITSLITVVYILTSKYFMPEQAKMPSATKDIALTNPHLDFFNIFSTDYKSSSLRIWILIVCFTLLGFAYEKRSKILSRSALLFSLSLYSLMLLSLQIIGLVTDQLMIISLVPVRFTAVLITVAFLIVTAVVIMDFFSKGVLERIVSFFFILFPSPLIALLFLIKEYSKRIKWRNSHIINRTAEATILGIVGYLVLPVILATLGYQWANEIFESELYNSNLNPLRTGFMNYMVPSMFSSKSFQVTFVAATLLVIIVPYLRDLCLVKFNSSKQILLQAFSKVIVYVFLIPVFIFATKDGMEYQIQWSFNGVSNSKVQSYANAQIWAKTNTAEDSVFFIDGSMPPFYTWRTLSQRPTSNPNPIWSLYNYPVYAHEFNLDRRDFWAKNLSNSKLDYYGQWDEKYFCLGQDLMKISYVVQNYNQKPLSFPIAYENIDFIIYKVRCSL